MVKMNVSTDLNETHVSPVDHLLHMHKKFVCLLHRKIINILNVKKTGILFLI
jgi:hypothetical protein